MKQAARSPSRVSKACGQTWVFRCPRRRSKKTAGTCGGTSPRKTSDACCCCRYTHHCLVLVGRPPAIGNCGGRSRLCDSRWGAHSCPIDLSCGTNLSGREGPLACRGTRTVDPRVG